MPPYLLMPRQRSRKGKIDADADAGNEGDEDGALEAENVKLGKAERRIREHILETISTMAITGSTGTHRFARSQQWSAKAMPCESRQRTQVQGQRQGQRMMLPPHPESSSDLSDVDMELTDGMVKIQGAPAKNSGAASATGTPAPQVR